MKMCCSCLLGLFLATLSGCMSMSSYKKTSLYEEASLRHHAYVTGTNACHRYGVACPCFRVPKSY